MLQSHNINIEAFTIQMQNCQLIYVMAAGKRWRAEEIKQRLQVQILLALRMLDRAAVRVHRQHHVVLVGLYLANPVLLFDEEQQVCGCCVLEMIRTCVTRSVEMRVFRVTYKTAC